MRGILPRATFGATLHAPSQADLGTTLFFLGGVGLKKAAGHVLCTGASGGQVRRVGKVCVHQGGGGSVGQGGLASWLQRPGDALTAREIASAADIIQDSVDSGTVLVNGPLWAISCAFEELGWVLHSGGSAVRVVASGGITMLNLTSPREVVRRAWEGWQDNIFAKETGRLAARRSSLGDNEDTAGS